MKKIEFLCAQISSKILFGVIRCPIELQFGGEVHKTESNNLYSRDQILSLGIVIRMHENYHDIFFLVSMRFSLS